MDDKIERLRALIEDRDREIAELKQALAEAKPVTPYRDAVREAMPKEAVPVGDAAALVLEMKRTHRLKRCCQLTIEDAARLLG